ncbi:MAG: hypothetical protein RSD07_07170 [Angelakisella sp.]
MMELLRRLLESYDGISPSMQVQTDLAGARAPGYSLSQKGEQVTGEDVLGRKTWTAQYTLHTRQVASGERDRQKAHTLLQNLGKWLSAQDGMTVGNCRIARIKVGTPGFQEAYDDGTAGWSMGLVLFCEDT